MFLKHMISILKYAKDPKTNIKLKFGLTHVPVQAFEQPKELLKFSFIWSS